MTKCKVRYEQLLSFTLNELSHSEHLIIQSHIKSCSICQINIEELTILGKVWNSPDTLQLSDSFVEQVMDNLPELDKKAYQQKNIHWNSVANFLIASAATFILLHTGLFSDLPVFTNQFSSFLASTTDQLQEASGQGIITLNSINLHFSKILQYLKF